MELLILLNTFMPNANNTDPEALKTLITTTVAPMSVKNVTLIRVTVVIPITTTVAPMSVKNVTLIQVTVIVLQWSLL